MNCYICKGNLEHFGTIPFGKNRENLPIVDTTPIKYYRCCSCGFICSPEMLSWSTEELSRRVYNEDYSKIDTGYSGIRATSWANSLDRVFPKVCHPRMVHLDYGSGDGDLSKLLVEKKWNSTSYDPFSSPNKPIIKFNFITAVEVIEHTTNIFDTLEDIKKYLVKDGVIMFSTLLVPKIVNIDWWYICARAGHIGLHTEKSLKLACKKVGLIYSRETIDLHLARRKGANFGKEMGMI